MFSLLSGLLRWFFSRPNLKLLILGLDNAGKTTTLETIKASAGQSTLTPDMIRPTLGFNVAQIERQKVQALLWDVGGQTALRTLWWQYFAETGGVLFVCDISDGDRFQESLHSLLNVVDHQGFRNRTIPVVVFLNKVDLLHPADLAPTLKRLFLKFHSLNWDSRGMKLLNDDTMSLMRDGSQIRSQEMDPGKVGGEKAAAKRRLPPGAGNNISQTTADSDGPDGKLPDQSPTSRTAVSNMLTAGATEGVTSTSDHSPCSACKGGRPCDHRLTTEAAAEFEDQIVAAPRIVTIIAGSALDGKSIGTHIADLLITHTKYNDESLPWKRTAPLPSDSYQVARSTLPLLYLLDSPSCMSGGTLRQTAQARLRLIDTSSWLQEAETIERLRSISTSQVLGGPPVIPSTSHRLGYEGGAFANSSRPQMDSRAVQPADSLGAVRIRKGTDEGRDHGTGLALNLKTTSGANTKDGKITGERSAGETLSAQDNSFPTTANRIC